jgi:hypothetical protein
MGQSSPVGVSSNSGYRLAGGFIPTMTGGVTRPLAPVANAATRITSSGFTANWGTVAGASGYQLDVAADEFFTEFVSGFESRDVGNASSCAVTGLNPESYYYYRVRATNAAGASNNSNYQMVRTYKSYPTSLTLNWTYHYTSLPEQLTDYASEDYQLIGFPGNSRQSISTFLESGLQGTMWEVYWDNGSNVPYPNYYVKYKDGDPNFVCSTGKAFWVLHKGDWAIINRAVQPAPLDTSTWVVTIPFPDTLKRFYLITNPFDIQISWDSIAAENDLRDSIRAWDRMGWYRTHDFLPFEGCLFFNGKGHSAIRVPWRLTSLAPERPTRLPPDSSRWRIDVLVRQDKYEDRTTSLGVSPTAARGMDDFEQRKPRGIWKVPDALFERPSWDTEFSEFATDIRPPFSDIEEWEMMVRSSDRKEVDLFFNGVDRVPSVLVVYLMDEARARAVDLRETHSYKFVPSTPKTRMKVLVGKAELVQEKLKGLLPTRFELLTNYPNPFNPSTTVPIAIPIKSHVTLDVYNILGQHVKRLVEGEMEPGRYYFDWNGTNGVGSRVASGVYFSRMRATGGIELTRKMLLVK